MAFGDADRDVFLDTAVFGSAVVSGGVTSTGVLSLQWLEESDGAGLPVRTQRPVLRVKRGTLSTPSLDAAVTVGGVAYVFRGTVGKSVNAAPSASGFVDWLLAGGTAD